MLLGCPVSSLHAEEFIPMPSKLDSFKFYSDARFRFQAEDSDSSEPRSRLGCRLHAGADGGFKDTGFSMGVRLETASTNDSTSNTLGGFFSKVGDEIFAGKAFLQWEGDNVETYLGKHSPPFVIDSAFWDSGINPEGNSESFSSGDLSWSFGQYIIGDELEDRVGSVSDAFMFAWRQVADSHYDFLVTQK